MTFEPLPLPLPSTVRCFVAFSVSGPWPDWDLQKPLLPPFRHLTLAFLGQRDRVQVLQQAQAWRPSLQVAPLLAADRWSLLPDRNPHVLALSTPLATQQMQVQQVRRNCCQAFGLQLPIPHDGEQEGSWDWHPHVTVSRDPKVIPSWAPLPLVCGDLHLYESLPDRVYRPIYSWAVAPAFEEFEHPADRAYRCRGSSWAELCLSLLWALAQEVPSLVVQAPRCNDVRSHAEAVALLNQILSEADASGPIPWKAVTFHGSIHQQTLPWIWEVVIDV